MRGSTPYAEVPSWTYSPDLPRVSTSRRSIMEMRIACDCEEDSLTRFSINNPPLAGHYQIAGSSPASGSSWRMSALDQCSMPQNRGEIMHGPLTMVAQGLNTIAGIRVGSGLQEFSIEVMR
jgi:hypothetical protein